MASISDLDAVCAAEILEILNRIRAGEKTLYLYIYTSDASYVIVELLLQSGGLILLASEILKMFVEYVVCGAVDFAKILEDLKSNISFIRRINIRHEIKVYSKIICLIL